MVLTTKGLVVVPLLVRVGLIQLVLHAQMMRMLVEMKMVMSDHSFQRQLAAPLSLVCHCWTFVVINDKGEERLIKASGYLSFFGFSLHLKICTAGYSL